MGENKFDELVAQAEKAREHYIKFQSGVKVESTRARQSLMRVKELAHELRKTINELRK